MSATEERLKILSMLEDGKITAEEASTLLRAIDGGTRRSPSMAVTPEGQKRFLRIQVTDLASGSAKVNVTLPMGLVGAGLRMAERFAPEFEGFDMQELEELLASGAEGKLIDVMDPEDNERVEIYVE
jgi:DNA-binding transcriptional ArsR family regulator